MKIKTGNLKIAIILVVGSLCASFSVIAQAQETESLEQTPLQEQAPPSEQQAPQEVIFDKAVIRILGHSRVHPMLNIEIARTQEQILKGFSGRTQIADDQGMLFYFQKMAPVAMWMKDVPFPLDILFLDDKGRIVKIVPNAVPFSIMSIYSEVPVKAVLEIKGGMAKKLNLRLGDIVVHNIFYQ